MTEPSNNAHIVLMSIGILLCAFVFLVKGENDEEVNMRI